MQVFNELAHRHYYFTSEKDFVEVLHELEELLGLSLHAEHEGDTPDGFLSRQAEEFAVSIYDTVELTPEQQVTIESYGKV